MPCYPPSWAWSPLHVSALLGHPVCLGFICSLTLGSCYIIRKANETSPFWSAKWTSTTTLVSPALSSVHGHCTVAPLRKDLPMCLFTWQNGENLSQLFFWSKNQQAFPAKGQVGNISGFVGYSVSHSALVEPKNHSK